MVDTEIFDLLYTHLENRTVNNVCDQLNSNANYQECENLNLPKEHCQIIEQWTDNITARNAAYSSVVFRTGMKCCLSLMIQLADIK